MDWLYRLKDYKFVNKTFLLESRIPMFVEIVLFVRASVRGYSAL